MLKHPAQRILITGMAGFIGFHLAKRLASLGFEIVGLDRIVGIERSGRFKELRVHRLEELGFRGSEIRYGHALVSQFLPNLRFVQVDLLDVEEIMNKNKWGNFDFFIHLAAQVGVRHSANEPHSYIADNITGFLNVLELAKVLQPKHLFYASSSSVYGEEGNLPSREDESTGKLSSVYSVTKKADELLADVYFKVYNINMTGMRFFTVYGPWGRPDMAYFSFTDRIMRDEPIELNNYGRMKRDFTYVEDVVEGIARLIDSSFSCENNLTGHRIVNIGTGNPISLGTLVEAIESLLGKKANKRFVSKHPCDVEETCAHLEQFIRLTGLQPRTELDTGLRKFVDWYLKYQLDNGIRIKLAKGGFV